MTTATQAITVERIDRDGWDADYLAEDGPGIAAVGFTNVLFDEAGAPTEAVAAWERDVVDAAIAEVNVQMGQLLADAIERRPPWTWEPDR